uniref:dCMP deaminase n=1 Tax=Macrostomum lignano TaxID=282301 RepID=A0A1I8HAE0_9PLAT
NATLGFQANSCSSQSSGESGKRADYISWEEYFMSVAFLSAQRSKDPATQAAAFLPWQRQTPGDPLGSKYLFVCHAEMNAIMNKNSADVRDCTLYVALFPCNECAKIIVQSGITEVVYLSDKYCAHRAERGGQKNLPDGRRAVHAEPASIVIDFDQLPEETEAALALTL